jgi:hypothetical protein
MVGVAVSYQDILKLLRIPPYRLDVSDDFAGAPRQASVYDGQGRTLYEVYARPRFAGHCVYAGRQLHFTSL